MELNHQKHQEIKINKDNIMQRLVRIFNIKEKSETVRASEANECRELLDSIKSARKEWASANTNFEFANDNQLIDYYSYKIKACEVRYEYLLRKAKEQGLKVDLLETNDAQSNKYNNEY